MIRFGCPRCKAVLEAPDHKAGVKFTCPQCQQRLQIPQPTVTPLVTPEHNKTVLGSMFTSPESDEPRLVNAGGSPPPPPPAKNMIKVACPECGRGIMLAPHELSLVIECAGCEKRFVPADRLSGPTGTAQQALSEQFAGLADSSSSSVIQRRIKNTAPHSGLGIASFIIAFLMAGLDILLILVIALGMGQSRQRVSEADLAAKIMAGGISLACLNLTAVPICLVGIGLAIVALTTQHSHNHLYSWIGLLTNGMIVLTMLGIYIAGVIVSGHVR